MNPKSSQSGTFPDLFFVISSDVTTDDVVAMFYVAKENSTVLSADNSPHMQTLFFTHKKIKITGARGVEILEISSCPRRSK